MSLRSGDEADLVLVETEAGRKTEVEREASEVGKRGWLSSSSESSTT